MASGPGFELSGVAHLIQPWGEPARDLDGLRHGIAAAPAEVIFHHAVQYRLRHPGADEQPRDDFSAWIGGVAQDDETAERLSFVVQARHATAESLRAELLEVLDAIPTKRRVERDAPEGSAFPFLSAISLRFSIGMRAHDGQELVDALLAADACVWFFHLVEEPWTGGGHAPLLAWLRGTSDDRLATWLEEAAGSGLPIDKVRARVQTRWRRSKIGRHLAEATRAPEDARREAARQAVVRLVRRRRGSGDTR